MSRYESRALTITLILAILAFSCGIPFAAKDGATVRINIGGAIPRIVQRTEGPASRAVPFATANIRIRAVEADGNEHAAASPYSVESGAAVEMRGLPIGVPLDIYVEALGSGDAILTSWHTEASLNGGTNAFSATMIPATDAVTACPVAGLPSSAPVADLARNGTRFDSFSGLTPGEEVHFVYDTGKAEYAYLETYSSSWTRLTPMANDQADGWTVVTVPEDGVVNVAVSNCVVSPGYPERTINGFVQARRTYFVSPAGSGAGTSRDPAALSHAFIIASPANYSLFMRDGEYNPPEGYLAVSNRDVRIYGGFSAGDWAIRDTERKATVVFGSSSSNSYAIQFYQGASGAIDGVSLHGPTVSDSNTNSIGLNLRETGNFVAHDCEISGTEGGTPSNTAATWTFGASINNCAPEFSRCAVNGGSFQLNTGFSCISTGININCDSSQRPFIHNCGINAGSISGSQAGVSAGVQISGSAEPVISQCMIWGGKIELTGGNATTYGIDHQGSGVLTVASSLISGGYCVTPNTAECHGVNLLPSNSISILGCTIDVGYAVSTMGGVGSNSSALYTPNTSETGTRIDGCLVFSSSQDSPGLSHDLIWQNGTSSSNPNIASISGSAFFGRNPGRTLIYMQAPRACASLDDFRSATNESNDGDASTSVTSQFVDYLGAPESFSEFLKADWRPRSGAAYAGSDSGIGPAFMGIQDLIAQYPSLGLDLAGNSRPSTWARGAYER